MLFAVSGGAQVEGVLRRATDPSHTLAVSVTDHGDGLYGLTATPDRDGEWLLAVKVEGQPIMQVRPCLDVILCTNRPAL